MRRVRVLLADQHQIVTEGLRSLLASEVDVVGAVSDGLALVEEARRLHPELIVSEITLPLMNGIDATAELRKEGPHPKVIILTMHRDIVYAARAFEAGAAGYVLKHADPADLITAIREVTRGRPFVSPNLDLVQVLMQRAQPQGEFPLTLRQREVLRLLAEGYSAKEVAALLQISPRTAEFHKYRIMDMLGLRTNAELIHYAIKSGIAVA